MRKLTNALLSPADDAAYEYMKKLKIGEDVTVTVKRSRNPLFHRKYFALLKLAFDAWEPAPLPVDPESRWMKGVVPQKNFERFRRDVIILAGYYEAYFRLNGEVRIEARSISFSSMSQDEFEALYSATIDVVLQAVLPSMDDAGLRALVEGLVLGYA